jgi:hypothetical protein
MKYRDIAKLHDPFCAVRARVANSFLRKMRHYATSGLSQCAFWVARSWQTVYPTAVGMAAFQAVRCISGGAMAIESLPKRLPASQGSGMEVLC